MTYAVCCEQSSDDLAEHLRWERSWPLANVQVQVRAQSWFADLRLASGTYQPMVKPVAPKSPFAATHASQPGLPLGLTVLRLPLKSSGQAFRFRPAPPRLDHQVVLLPLVIPGLLHHYVEGAGPLHQQRYVGLGSRWLDLYGVDERSVRKRLHDGANDRWLSAEAVDHRDAKPRDTNRRAGLD